jgi:hypothetical protein
MAVMIVGRRKTDNVLICIFLTLHLKSSTICAAVEDFDGRISAARVGTPQKPSAVCALFLPGFHLIGETYEDTESFGYYSNAWHNSFRLHEYWNSSRTNLVGLHLPT